MDLLGLIEKYPDPQKWNIKELSSNTSVSIEILAKFNDWDWDALSENLGITDEIVLKYVDRPWNWQKLSWNKSITLELILQLREKPWNWLPVYSMRAYYLGFWKQDMSLPWPWKEVSRDSTLTLEFVDKYSDKDWDWKVLSNNLTFTKEFLQKHIDKPWDWWAIYSKQSNLVVEVLGNRLFEKIPGSLDNPVPLENYHYEHPTVYPDLIPEIIDPNLPWNWFCMSRAKNLTLEFVAQHSEKAWDWDYLSKESSFDLDQCLQRDFPWNYDLMVQNPKFTFDLVDRYPDKPWNWSKLTVFPNIDKPTLLPIRNTYYYKKALKLSVWHHINHYPKQLEKVILLPFPTEMIHEISFLAYWQN